MRDGASSSHRARVNDYCKWMNHNRPTQRAKPRWPTGFGHLGRQHKSYGFSIFRCGATPEGQISPLAPWG